MSRTKHLMKVLREAAKRAVQRNAAFLNKVTKEQKGLIHQMKKHLKKR